MDVERPVVKGHESIDVLTEEFLERYRRCEHPSITEYVARHPTLAEEIRELFPTLAVLERLGPRPDEISARPVDATIGNIIPRQLGEYQLLREVGRGGMGIVYEAEQLSLGRRVALKVLPSHAVLSSNLLTRFQNEARAAARLHHTNIVPVFGVGEDQGIYYYAMQFIQGQGLDAVLEELRRLRHAIPSQDPKALEEQVDRPLNQPLSGVLAQNLAAGRFVAEPALSAGSVVRNRAGDGQSCAQCSASADGSPANSALEPPAARCERSDVFRQSAGANLSSHGTSDGAYFRSVARMGLQVAEALAHAHGQGVLHRDIKPSNLLLDALGCVWVTDFGLAKQEGGDLTSSGDVVGTLRYLAPERFRGASDARTDIYGLGVTLYELLTTEPAFAMTDRVRLVHDIVEVEPTPPRCVVPQLPRDLETIVLTAMAKDPGQRYATAAEMAADLRRFLDDQPIGARRTWLVERVWRWCVRRPALAGLAAALLLSLVGGLGGVLWQWGRAELNLHEAVRQKGLAETSLSVARSETLRAARNLEEAGRQRSIAEQEAQRAETNYQLARHAVDDLLTLVSEDDLMNQPGFQPLRLRLLTRALEYYQEMLAKRADDPKTRSELAASFLRVAMIKRLTGPPAEARDSYRKAIAVFEQVISNEDEDRKANLRLVQAYNELALLQIDDRDFAEADRGLQRARQLITNFVEAMPDSDTGQFILAMTFNNVAWCVSQSPDRNLQSRLEEAIQFHKQALEIYRRLVTDHPDSYHFQRGLSNTLSNMARRNMDARRYEEAQRLFEECLTIRLDLLTKKPDSLDMRSLLAATYNALADVILRSPRMSEDAFVQAVAHYEKSLEIQERLARENPAVVSYNREVTGTLRNMSELYARHNDLPRALDLRRQVNTSLEAGLRQDDAKLLLHADWAGSLGIQAELERKLERHADALASRSRAREAWKVIQQQPAMLQQYRASVIKNLAGLVLELGFQERLPDLYATAVEWRELCQNQAEALLSLSADLERSIRAATRGATLDAAAVEAAEKCLDLAIEVFREGATGAPKHLKSFIRSHPYMRDYETLMTLDASLERDPKNVTLLARRSALLRQLGHVPRAEADWSCALEVVNSTLRESPNDTVVLRQRALMHFDAQHWPEAASDSAEVLARLPDDAEMFLCRVRSVLRLGDWRDANDGYRRLWQMKRRQIVYLLEWCRAAHELSLGEELQAHAKTLMGLAGKDAKNADATAWQLMAENDIVRFPDMTLELAEQAVRLDPQTSYRTTLGGIYFRLNRYQEAIESLRPAADGPPGELSAFAGFWLAMSYHNLGEQEKAQNAFRRALNSWKAATNISRGKQAYLRAVWKEAKALLGGSEKDTSRS